MNEFLHILLVYSAYGVAVMFAYSAIFRSRPRWRHIPAWPVVLFGYMIWARTLPRWLKPAPRSIRRYPPVKRS